MKALIQYRIITIFLLIILFKGAKAQNKGSIYLGGQPECTVEKEYARGESDMNLLPFV